MVRIPIVYPVLMFFLIFSCTPAFAETPCPERAQWHIAIDIGHTPKRPGAISARGVPEYEFNREMALVLRDELAVRGFAGAFVINETGWEISLTERVETAAEQKADLFISVHHDSVQPGYLSPWTFQGKKLRHCEKFTGYSLFYSEINADPETSLRFAEILGGILLQRGFVPTLHHAEPVKGENRILKDPEKGIYQFDDLVVLKKTKMPAILMECGIIVNRERETVLASPEYRKKLALAVTDAVDNLCTGIILNRKHPENAGEK